MCIHHSTIKKLTEEVETAKQTMQKQVDTAEKTAAEQCCQKLNSIREKLKKEREKEAHKFLQAGRSQIQSNSGCSRKRHHGKKNGNQKISSLLLFFEDFLF